jgi:hypothetical protein
VLTFFQRGEEAEDEFLLNAADVAVLETLVEVASSEIASRAASVRSAGRAAWPRR